MQDEGPDDRRRAREHEGQPGDLEQIGERRDEGDGEETGHATVDGVQNEQSAPESLAGHGFDLTLAAGCSRLAAVDELLLDWFAEHGRDLPWRRTRDPYAILVSEVMLQQTQVERVVPRYLRWLERWPTAKALAAAGTDDVIREWQGLGYNRRAVNLQRAARRIAHDGWPADLTELPGVGPYTAAAIRAFAFGEPVLPLDTNVLRVHERTGHAFRAECGQALMDLGRTVCIARIPRCDACPLADACPSRGRRYEPLRKQSGFEGSFRQRRAQTLRLVTERPRPAAELDAAAVAALRRDGLVAEAGDLVMLPR